MASRPIFYVKEGLVREKNIEFEWFSGFAVSQKQKSIASLHSKVDGNALEVSTKSTNPLGVKLSAFNLKLNGYPLENIFQSSKTFENGGPYLDILEVHPKYAKKDERLHNSGELTCFTYQDKVFPLEPKTLFYDYIYCLAVKETLTQEEIKEISNYDYFTDIEFNPNKSINTQARSVALIKLMLENDVKDFVDFHKKHVFY